MSRAMNPPTLSAALLLLLSGAAILGWLWLRAGQVPPTAFVVAALPVFALFYVALRGSPLREDIAVRVWVVWMFGTILPLFYLSTLALPVPPATPLPWRLDARWAYIALHALIFLVLAAVALMIATATWGSRLDPAPGTAAVSGSVLRQRLNALGISDLGVNIAPGIDAGEMLANYRDPNGKRWIRLRLYLDEARHRVSAKEFSAISGDAPRTASEARMRFTRDHQPQPDASLIWSRNWSITLPQAERRRRLGVQVDHGTVRLPPDAAARFTDDDLPYLLAEVVHQSGWTWQGVFFNAQR
jgi:hypothetical protein